MKKTLLISKKMKTAVKYLLLLFIVTTFNASIYAQERKLIYDVMKNGNAIGKIVFIELLSDQKKMLSLISEVKTKFIFSFSDYAAETASFENGIMVFSSFYQKQNGSDKAKKMTIASGQFYKFIDDGVSKLIACDPIRYNMLSLYTSVPEQIHKVYSDNYQKLLDIQKVESNKYKLSLPDGNYNYYTYSNNVCTKVDIERTLFTIQFVLRNE